MLPFPSPGDLPDPGIEPGSPALTGGFFTVHTTWGTHCSGYRTVIHFFLSEFWWVVYFEEFRCIYLKLSGGWTWICLYCFVSNLLLKIFFMWIIFKVFIDIVIMLLLCFLLVFGQEACGRVLAPWSGIEPTTACIGRWSLNHWSAREVPLIYFLTQPIQSEWCSFSLLHSWSVIYFWFYFLDWFFTSWATRETQEHWSE